ncbi:hypothetical protein BGW80DRAFT_1252449 [Lactifluus volemus]|nr:hypothetical protein BGW80DRAFT_1252449 [Lactifluus volemus]
MANARRTSTKRDTGRTRDMKETKRKAEKPLPVRVCSARPQRTGLWPKRKCVIAEGDRGPISTKTRVKQVRELRKSAKNRRERGNENREASGNAYESRLKLQGQPRGCPYTTICESRRNDPIIVLDAANVVG